jgi:hypothetical protein
MVAVECNRQDVCEYLVEAGADVNLYDAAGRDAMLYAAEKKHEDIMRTLQRAAGAGGSPSTICCAFCRCDRVKLKSFKRSYFAGHNLDEDRTDSGAPVNVYSHTDRPRITFGSNKTQVNEWLSLPCMTGNVRGDTASRGINEGYGL